MPSINPPPHNRNSETTDSWITPKWLIDKIGPFDLDSCACEPQPWPTAAKQFTLSDSGLMQPWHGFVFCNPPYGIATKYWLEKLASHNNGIALVYARTETKMFQRYVFGKADAVLFLAGRITFHYPDGTKPRKCGNSGGPSVLVGYGNAARDRLHLNAALGYFFQLHHSITPS